ncbi:Nucleosome assembly protein [Castilleja foliolosa]|uniref:Nucleosome assembly protein n=1 Tax=Castilleja foliolosa TaxID=1961234 RepID=A0ABD3DPW3_9LAMI
MGNNNDSFNVADLGAAYVCSFERRLAEDRADLVNALKTKLQGLAGKHSDVFENLSPNVRKRVESLQEIQSQHDDLEAKFCISLFIPSDMKFS